MKIIPYESGNELLEALMHGDKEVLMSYENKLAALQFLKLQDIDLVSEPHFNEAIKTISIKPKNTPIPYQYQSLPEEFVKQLKDYKHTEILIPDFRNSEAFYSECAHGPVKIISDEYSVAKSIKLYEYVGKIEKNLRIAYVRKFGTASVLKKQNKYRRDLPDHAVAQLDLSDMVSYELLKLSDDQIFLDQIKKAKDDDEIIQARHRKRIDDLDFGLGEDDFEEFRKVRNSVMHFRVVKTSQMKTLLDMASKFDLKSFGKIISPLE